MANYILNLLAWNRNHDRNIFTELELAEKIDPDNALYNYIAVGLLLEKACETKSKRVYLNSEGKYWKKEYRKEYSTKINRDLMNQAVEEYLKGTRKIYFKTYTTEMLQERLNIMGKAQSMVESIRQLRFSAATILPYLNHLRSIARDTWKYAELLQKEGKQQKALRIIAPWKKFIKQITEDSNFLIAVLVDMAIVTIGKEKIPEIYRLAGKNNLAKRAEQELTAVFTATNKWKKTPIVRDKKTSGKQAVFASNVLAGLKVNFSDTELAVSRKIEYCAIEKLALKVLNAFFMLAMLGALISSFCWEIYSKQKALSLAPSPKLIGKVFIWGVILPLLLYFLISITGFMGGHQYNIWINSPSLIAQMGILLFIILALTFSFAQKHVRQRCRELRVKIPDLKKNKWKYLAVIILCSILGIFAIVPLQSFWETIPPKELLGWGITVVICLLGLSAIFMEEYLVSIFARRKYALYYGSLSRTLVPILALTMI
ncbi:MAG: hypothetical protein KAS17_08595, partial [Victivallaceae bacterium]|nr:hypothetical protein [Victivallaceae bacterium]